MLRTRRAVQGGTFFAVIVVFNLIVYFLNASTREGFFDFYAGALGDLGEGARRLLILLGTVRAGRALAAVGAAFAFGISAIGLGGRAIWFRVRVFTSITPPA